MTTKERSFVCDNGHEFARPRSGSSAGHSRTFVCTNGHEFGVLNWGVAPLCCPRCKASYKPKARGRTAVAERRAPQERSALLETTATTSAPTSSFVLGRTALGAHVVMFGAYGLLLAALIFFQL